MKYSKKHIRGLTLRKKVGSVLNYLVANKVRQYWIPHKDNSRAKLCDTIFLKFIKDTFEETNATNEEIETNLSSIWGKTLSNLKRQKPRDVETSNNL